MGENLLEDLPEEVKKFVNLANRIDKSLRRDLKCRFGISSECEQYNIISNYDNFCCNDVGCKRCDLYQSLEKTNKEKRE